MATREPVYRPGTDPGGSPMFGGASPEAFGAAVGRGLEDIGDVADKLAEKQRQRDKQTAATSAGVQLAQDTGDIDVFSQAARETAAPGGDGHTEAVLGELDKRRDAALAKIPNRQVREAYGEEYAQLRARVLAREDGWQRGQHVAKRIEDFDKTGTLLANQQAANPTGDGLETALQQVETQGALAVENPDLRDKAVREQQRKIAVSWGNAMVDSDHEGLLTLLDHHVLDPYLEPGDIAQLRNGAHVEQRRQAAEDRRIAAESEAKAREQISLFKKRVEAGDQPSDSEFDTAAALAKTIDDPTLQFDVETMRGAVNVNKETRDWTPAMFDQAIGDLRAKGDKRSSAENILLKQLETISGPRVSEFNQDPQAWAAQRGNQAPALDFANPTRDAVEQRVAWARALRQSSGLGYTPYLSDAEMQPMKERLQSGGAAGLVDVAGSLRDTFGAGVGGEIARQLAPGNRDLELMVGIKREAAALYKRGADALARNPKLVDAETANDAFGDFAAGIPPDIRTPVYNAARQMAAGLADGAGHDQVSRHVFERALQLATGRELINGQHVGGMGTWHDEPVWLPPRVSQEDFDRRLARATGPQLVTAAGGLAPRYMGPDGKPGRTLKPSEIKALELETVGPGVYHVKGPIGGVLVDKNGRPWTFDARKLP